MSESILLVSRPSEGVAQLKLNRPERKNALNMALRVALADAFRALSVDAEVRAIVVSGEGGSFSAGADLNEYVDASTIEVLKRDMHRLWGAIAECPKPVIAAVNGYALGGGCELALHADIIVAGRSALFGQPEVKIGLIPGGGATQRVTRSVGKFAAMRLLLTGESLPADEALALGLISKLTDDAEVETVALDYARRIAALPPIAVRQIKELVLGSMNTSLDAGLRLERKAFQIIFSTEDKTEGIKAFLEKRPPHFSGN
jgi:enoyl-CoA hydratase